MRNEVAVRAGGREVEFRSKLDFNKPFVIAVTAKVQLWKIIHFLSIGNIQPTWREPKANFLSGPNKAVTFLFLWKTKLLKTFAWRACKEQKVPRGFRSHHREPLEAVQESGEVMEAVGLFSQTPMLPSMKEIISRSCCGRQKNWDWSRFFRHFSNSLPSQGRQRLALLTSSHLTSGLSCPPASASCAW